MREFFLKWGRYLSILLSPDVVISVIAASIFGYWSTIATDNTTEAVSAVVMAILAGVAGARLSTMIIEQSRKGQIFTRGQSAVRGLGLILANLGTLEAQLEKARAGCKDSQLEKDFMYIKSLAVVVQRQAVNSMEEWKDILPEADVLRMIDDLSKKVSDADELRDALESIQNKLNEAQNDAGTKSEQLTTLKQQKAKLERELREKELEALRVLPSSLSLSTSPLFSVSSASSNHITPGTISTSGLQFDEKGNIKIGKDG